MYSITIVKSNIVFFSFSTRNVFYTLRGKIIFYIFSLEQKKYCMYIFNGGLLPKPSPRWLACA